MLSYIQNFQNSQKKAHRINNSIKSGIEQLNKEANSVELEKAGLQIDKLIDILEEK